MPKVGERHFPYTKKGKADAKAYALRTGKKITPGNKTRGTKYK